MKTIIISLILFFALMFFSGIFASIVLAKDFSPLENYNIYKKFEARFGFDQNDGRYRAYHYEF